MLNLRFALPVVLAIPIASSVASCAAEAPVVPATLHFEFHSAFLMNLHHFLVDAARHPGRIDAVKWSVPPTADEMAAMHEAVAFYATTFGKRDLLFDDQLRDIKHALARARRAPAGGRTRPAARIGCRAGSRRAGLRALPVGEPGSRQSRLDRPRA